MGLRRIRSREGQASVLIASMILTFLLFFAFVVNVGMLVHAKINLQNAADAAAFAGAATQARQLTTMSYINYEMRRQYKKFLYRYYIIGTMSQHSFPFNAPGVSGGGMNASRRYIPNQTPDKHGTITTTDSFAVSDFGAPSICLNLSGSDNPCQVSAVSSSRIQNDGGGLGLLGSDPINQALEQQLQAIERIRQNNCSSIAITNHHLAWYWLYNTDPKLKNVQPGVSDRARTIAALIEGLGLVPKEFLLSQRMKTLQKYLNEPAKTGVNPTLLNTLTNAPQVALHERTVQAYLSAYNSLGESAFDNADEIVMDELLPEQLLRFKGEGGADDAVRASFDVFTTRFGMVDASTGNPNAMAGCNLASIQAAETGSTRNTAAHCLLCPYPISLKGGVPVGFVKDPSVLTYYAVRLQAPAKVLFNPFGGTITLRAYAAAQPFGSRIGPMIDSKAFVSDYPGGALGGATLANKICSELNGTPRSCLRKLPNLPILGGNTADKIEEPTLGWNRSMAQFGYVKQLTTNASAVSSMVNIVDSLSLARGYQGGMVPNSIEQGQFNFPLLDLPASDARMGTGAGVAGQRFNFEDSFTWFMNRKGEMAFWAPLSTDPSFSADDLFQEIKNEFQRTQGTTADANLMPDDLLKTLQKGLTAYLQELKENSGGEDGEGFNMVVLKDAFNTPEQTGVPAKKIDMPPQARPLLLARTDLSDEENQKRIKTSFVPDRERKNPDTGDARTSVFGFGRNTYSVKFVPVRSLASPSAGGAPLQNPLPASTLSDELPFLEH